jgi:multiple RNA-binding domain-containing protein 1
VRAAELDASIFMGRLIHILPGKRPPPPPEAEAEGGEGGEGGERKGATSSFKVKKEAELKAGAGNRSAWNTLFMRADTVAEAVAAHYGESRCISHCVRGAARK